jgi:hypothetical protein
MLYEPSLSLSLEGYGYAYCQDVFVNLTSWTDCIIVAGSKDGSPPPETPSHYVIASSRAVPAEGVAKRVHGGLKCIKHAGIYKM